jgi:hypothetical protein
MISKCPQCGASYPTHHGKICKQCTAKNAKEAAGANFPKPAPVVAKQEQSKPVTQIPDGQPSNVSNQNSSATNKTTESKPAGISYQDKKNILSSSMESKKEEKPIEIMPTCPKCGTQNVSDELFCPDCGHMLLVTVAGKQVEYPLSDIKAAFPDHISKLKKLGIDTTLKLLSQGFTPKKRQHLAMRTGISETLIGRMVQQSDLLRIDKVEPNEAYLLENIGLTTIKALEKKTAQEIMDLIKAQKNHLHSKNVIILPETVTVKKWLENLKQIPKILT